MIPTITIVVGAKKSQLPPPFSHPSANWVSLMCVVALLAAACVCEQFVVAMEGIKKENDSGDREARAQLDEAVVLEEEADGVRDSTAAPPRSPLTVPRVCLFVVRVDVTSLGSDAGTQRLD